jgi:HK97 family phage major capsid protein
MKTSITLKEERSDIISQLENIKDVATTEERDLTSEENNQVDGLLTEVDNLDAKIERAEKMETIKRNAAVVSGVSAKKNNEASNWSLFKAVNEIRNGGGLTGLEAEMHQEAEKEARKAIQGIGIPTMLTEKRTIDQGTSAIAPVSVGAFIDSLQEAGLYNRVGIQDLGTVAADTLLPIAGGSTVDWALENAATSDTGADFGKITLSPKRITGVANISNVILAQNGPAAEAAVMRDMGRNMATKIDAAMFASTDLGGGAPGCIAGTSGTLTFTESTTAGGAGMVEDMLTAIQTVANNHGLDGNLAFVNNWKMYSNLKTGVQVSAVYPAYVSSATGSSGTTSADGIFGDFSRVYYATFGPSSILVDPYTDANSNEVRLVMNNHVDFAVASGASFVKYTSLL